MLEVACSTEQKIKITSAPQTAGGQPSAFDGALRLSVAAGDGTIVQDASDPLSFFVVSGDAPGDSTFLIEADADLGAGTVLIQDTVKLTASNPNAASFGFSAGQPEPK